MRSIPAALAVILCGPLALHCALAQEVEGTVVEVPRGDMLVVLDKTATEYRMRLHGIDAPDEKPVHGIRARLNLSKLTLTKPIRAECRKQEASGVRACVVWTYPPTCPNCGLTLDVGLMQVWQGYASHNPLDQKEQSPAKQKEYAEAQAEAKAKRHGLWVDKSPVAP